MNKKVLITGGAGFIGSHIADRLIDEGYAVSVLDNLSTGNLDNVNNKARFYEGDIRNDAQSVLETECPDYVIHNAGQINVRTSIENPLYDASINVLGSLSLFEACKKSKVKRLIFASSGGTVYGASHLQPLRENSELAPINPYGVAKLTVEKYLHYYSSKRGLDYIALRYGNVYGPRQNPKGEAGVISVFIDDILSGRAPSIWGDGKQTRDFIYVDDVVEANLRALNYEGEEHVFNIGSGKEASVNDIFRILKKLSSCGNPVFNDKYKEAIPRICLDTSLALRELDWRTRIPLEEGIGRTFEWFQSKL